MFLSKGIFIYHNCKYNFLYTFVVIILIGGHYVGFNYC